MYLIHEFHNLSWITEINELFHDILIYWDAPVYADIFNFIFIKELWKKVYSFHKNIKQQCFLLIIKTKMNS